MTDFAKLAFEVDTKDLRKAGEALDSFKRSGDSFSRSTRQIQGSLGRMERAMQSIQRTINQVKAALLAFGAVRIGQQVLNTGIAFQKMETTLRFATGSLEGAKREMEFVRAESNRLGQDILTAGRAYSKLAASASTLGLTTAQIRQTFTGVSSAATVMGLSAYEAEGAFLALQQMLAKGTVQAEELRGQLGERIPTAFADAAAAMGMTTRQLSKSLEQGEVEAKEFVNRLSAFWVDKFGSQIPDATKNAQKQINDFGNSIAELQNVVATSGFLEGLTMAMNEVATALSSQEAQDGARALGAALGDSFKFLVNNSETILRVLAAVSGAFAAVKLVRFVPGGGGLLGPLAGAGALGGAFFPEIKKKLDTVKDAAADLAKRLDEEFVAAAKVVDEYRAALNALDLQKQIIENRDAANETARQARLAGIDEEIKGVRALYDAAVEGYSKAYAARLAFTQGQMQDMMDLEMAVGRQTEARKESVAVVEEQVDAAVEFTKKEQKVINALSLELNAFSQTNKEREISANLAKLGADASDEARAAVIALTEAIYEENVAREANEKAVERAAELAEEEERIQLEAEKRWREMVDERDRLTASMEREVSQNAELTKAVRISQREYEITRWAMDLMSRSTLLGADAAREMAKALIDSEKAFKVAQDEANAFASALKDAVGQIENNFQQLFADIFQDGLDGFQDFADGILDIFKRLAAQIATQFVIGDILGLGSSTGLLSAATGGGGGVAGIVGSLGSIISPTSVLGDLLGLGGTAPAAGGAAGALGGGASSFLSAPLNFISQIFNGGLSSTVGGLASNFALSGIGQSLGLSGIASPAAANGLLLGPEVGLGLTGAGSQFATAAAQFATLPVAAPLGFLALGFMEALGNTSSGPAVGTNFDTAGGRISGFRVTTDNGGSTELGNALGEAIQTVVNSALDLSGGSLVDGAFDGEVGFANGRFGSSIIMPGIASQDFRGRDSTGIFGITDDLRKNFGRRGTDEQSMRGAIVDFVSRNFIDALDRGLVDGVSDEAAATMRIGFGNLARAAANGFTEEDFNQALSDIEFIAGFDALAESLRDVGDTSATAADRLTMAAESQEAFNASLEDVRTNARTSATESGSPLAGISDFVDQAVRVFDPKGPLSFQLRMLLEGNQDTVVSESITRDIVSGGRFGVSFNPRLGIGAGPINDRNGRDINLEPYADQLFSVLASNINDDAGYQRLGRNVTSGFQETLRGDPTTLFQQLGDFDLFGVNFIKNLDLSSVEEAVFDVFGPDGEFVTTFRNQFERAGDQVDYVSLTRDLVNILIEAGAQVPDDLPVDPFFVDGRDRVVEALNIAKDQVEAYFAGVTETIGEQIQGPLSLFEEIVPAVSPLVDQFEQIKAQVEATVPDLQALNEDLAAFGQELIDVGQITTDAINGAREATQDEFLAGLGIGVSSDGTLSGSTIDFGGIASLAETIRALDLNSASLFEVDGRGLLPQVQGRIDEILVEGINALLSEAESYEDTLEQIQGIFGDRITGLSGIISSPDGTSDNTTVEEAVAVMPQALAEWFADQVNLEDAQKVVRDQITAQAALAQAATEAADKLNDLSLQAGDNARSLEAAIQANLSSGSLSPLSPSDRLAAARSGFDSALALARTGDIENEDVQEAINELPGLQQAVLEASRDYYGNSEEYLQEFNRTQDAMKEIAADQRSLESRYLTEAQAQTTLLESINTEMETLTDQLAANDNVAAYVSAGGDQYVATGAGGIVGAGFDLGYRPDRAMQILQALSAAGLPLPEGFGEGQLNALRASNPNVDQIVSAMGFADGGVFSGGSIVSAPTTFPIGIMGEAGPEAIMPLHRGADGSLGVRMQDGNQRAMIRVMMQGFAGLEARMAAVEANTASMARDTSLARNKPQRAARAA